jgi:5-methylcytosine-specific restriction endonuclease McrA
MSKAWAKGSTRAWRKTRLRILARDGWLCQIKGPTCTTRATQVHHVLGKGVSERDEHLLSACQPCNNAIGSPVGRDPEPTPRTRW